VGATVSKNFPYNSFSLRGLATTIKNWFLANRWVDSLRWRFSQRKIAKLQSRQEISRRGFFQATTALLVSAFVKLTPQSVREQIISEYIKSSAGRTKLAMSMIQPLRARLDYQAIGRKVFLIEQMPTGAVPVYDRELAVSELVTDKKDV
jgi:hypothetical protein